MGFCHNGHDLDVVGVHRSYERRYGYEKLTLEVCNACHTRLAKREVDRRQQRHEDSREGKRGRDRPGSCNPTFHCARQVVKRPIIG